MNWPDLLGEPWRRVHDEVGKALVALEWTETRIGHPDAPVTFATADLHLHRIMGVVANIRGFWFLVTAAHALRRAFDTEERGRRSFKYHLMTGLHRRDGKSTNIPMTLDAHDVVFDESDITGDDVAAIALSRETVNKLIGLGVQFVNERFAADPTAVFDGYAVPGIPEELAHSRPRISGTGLTTDLRLTVVMLPVEAEASPPPEMRLRNLFTGRVVSMSGVMPDGTRQEITSLKGMSGAPVFGLALNGDEIKLRLVAVQTCFAPDHQVLGGTRARRMLHRLGIGAICSRAGQAW